MGPTLPIVCGAMGYHNIVPQVCSLLEYDRRRIVLAILVGTGVVAALSLSWLALLFGAFDASELLELQHLGRPVGAVLADRLASSWWGASLRLFSLSALLTSQMGVLKSLTDFCAGSSQRLSSRSWLLIWVVAPGLAAWTYPGIFFQALEWAGGVGETMLNGALPVLLTLAIAKGRAQTRRWLVPLGAAIAAFFFWVLLQELPIWSH